MPCRPPAARHFVSDRTTDPGVMAGHSRSKNGVASLAYDPATHPLKRTSYEARWIAGSSPAMTP
jgi:hypothetical protein